MLYTLTLPTQSAQNLRLHFFAVEDKKWYYEALAAACTTLLLDTGPDKIVSITGDYGYESEQRKRIHRPVLRVGSVQHTTNVKDSISTPLILTSFGWKKVVKTSRFLREFEKKSHYCKKIETVPTLFGDGRDYSLWLFVLPTIFAICFLVITNILPWQRSCVHTNYSNKQDAQPIGSLQSLAQSISHQFGCLKDPPIILYASLQLLGEFKMDHLIQCVGSNQE